MKHRILMSLIEGSRSLVGFFREAKRKALPFGGSDFYLETNDSWELESELGALRTGECQEPWRRERLEVTEGSHKVSQTEMGGACRVALLLCRETKRKTDCLF